MGDNLDDLLADALSHVSLSLDKPRTDFGMELVGYYALWCRTNCACGRTSLSFEGLFEQTRSRDGKIGFFGPGTLLSRRVLALHEIQAKPCTTHYFTTTRAYCEVCSGARTWPLFSEI